MTHITIRQAAEQDLPAIMEIIRAVFRSDEEIGICQTAGSASGHPHDQGNSVHPHDQDPDSCPENDDAEEGLTEAENVVRTQIEGHGFVYLAECDGRIVGCQSVHIPDEGEENLGREADLPEKELSRTAHMQPAAVLPEYRGYGIQRMMLMEAEKELKRRGYHYAAAAIPVKDAFSMENYLQLGYLISAEKRGSGENMNRVLLRHL